MTISLHYIQAINTNDNWMSRLSSHRIFPQSLSSTQPQKLLQSLFTSSNPNRADRHGQLPLVYAAGLANEEAMKQLLPHTDLSSVQEELHSQCTTLLHIGVQAPLWLWGRAGEGIQSSDADSHCCLKALYHCDR